MRYAALLGVALLASSAALAQTTTTTTITAEQQGKVRAYVMKERPASVKVTETVAVGSALPSSVTLHNLPSDVGVTGYSYGVVNDKTVLVEPGTRKIIQIIE